MKTFRGIAVMVAVWVLVGWIAGANSASAAVPPPEITASSDNSFVATDSTQPGGPIPNSPAFTPTQQIEIDGGGGILLGDTDDGLGTIVPDSLGFGLTVSANGAVFIDDVPTPSHLNQDLAIIDTASTTVFAPFWDDFNPGTCGDVLWDEFDTGTDIVIVIEWNNVCDFNTSGTDGYTFQARISASATSFEYHYADVQGTTGNDDSDFGQSATIGWSSGSQFVQYAFNRTTPTFPLDAGGFAIRFDSCQTATPTVTSSVELDAAINCYNVQTPPGDHTITLGAGISHPSGTPTIDSSNDTGNLTIVGQGFPLSGPFDPANNSAPLANLFTVDNPGPETVFDEMNLQDATLNGLLVNDGNVTLVDSQILRNNSAVVANGGFLKISQTTLTNNRNDGVRVTEAAAVVVIERSVIHANSSAGIVGDAGHLLVTNSTIANHGVSGIRANGATTNVWNSTIVNNNDGLEGGSNLTIGSTIVSNHFGSDCVIGGTNMVDGANNYSDGINFCFFETLTAGSLELLTTNGGPTQTAALNRTSSAVGGGNCGGVPVALDPTTGAVINGDLATDQRSVIGSFPRTSGANCDAGAFEANVCTTALPFVDTDTEIDDAIACYNAQTPAGDHTITFDGDIAHPSGPPTIDSSADSGNLTIEGAGHLLSGPGAPFSGLATLMSISNDGPTTTIRELTMAGDSLLGLFGEASVVVVEDSTLRDFETAILSQGNGADITVDGSAFENNRSGVFTQSSGRATVRASSFANSSFDSFGASANASAELVVSNSFFDGLGDAVRVDGLSRAVVSNSTIIDGAVIADQDSELVIANSTIVANGLIILGADDRIQIESSILVNTTGGSVCGASVNDRGHNFTSDAGGCGTGFSVLSPGSLASSPGPNGGPLPSVELVAGSNAVGNGQCVSAINDIIGGLFSGSELIFDTRGDGFARTIAANCDAGSFELGYQPCGDPTPTVNSRASLDDAIYCYNTQVPAGDHTITIGADISHPSSPPSVNSVADSGDLTITGTSAGTQNTLTASIVIANPGPTTTMSNITMRDSFDPAVVVLDGSVNLANVTSTNNLQALTLIDGLVTVTNSTFADSESVGVQVLGGSLVLSNSTVFNNGAPTGDPGIQLASGSVTVANSTVANSGGAGVEVDAGTATLWSSIVADNGGGDCVATGAAGNLAVTALPKSFDSDGSCDTGAASLSPGSLDPNGLADNGGDTETAALQPTSNAVGNGSCSDTPIGFAADGVLFGDLTTDQRGSGFERPKGSLCDAGAFEVNMQATLTDVADNQFYADAVTWAAANGITQGTTLTLFSPNADVTRAQMATFLWRLEGEPTGAAPHGFIDVAPPDFFDAAVAWLKEESITQGTSTTTFSPGAPVTRGEMATFLWRLAGEPPGPAHNFNDVVPADFFNEPVGWLASTGITAGTSATTFSPNNTLTRAEAVTFLLRYAQTLVVAG